MSIYSKKLSIIIPYKDTEEYIKECLDSVLAASESIDSEILLVNDFSSDRSDSIVASYAENHTKIKMLKTKTDTRGPGAARNLAINLAVGEFIAFADSDDVVLPDMYTDGLAMMKYHNADICICDSSRYKKGKQTFSHQHNRAFSKLSRTVTNLSHTPELAHNPVCWDKLYRHSFLKENNLFFPEDMFYEDNVFTYKTVAAAERIAINRNIAYLWRIREGGNPSITQREGEFLNFYDRTQMNNILAEFISSFSNNRDVRQAILKKSAWFFPFSAFSNIESMPDDVLSDRVKELKKFASKYFTEDIYNELPIIWEQTWTDINSSDIDKIRKDCEYRFGNYSKVPVEITDGTPRFKLNDQIITTERRSAYWDYDLSIPICYLRDYNLENNRLTMSGELYFPRVPVPFDESRVLKAFFYNVITGDKIELPRNNIRATVLTESIGSYINPDDGQEFSVDYEGSGFQIGMDMDEILKNASAGKYLIMLEYYSPVKSGSRLLRGIKQDLRGKLGNLTFQNESKTIKTAVDKRQTLQFTIEDNDV